MDPRMRTYRFLPALGLSLAVPLFPHAVFAQGSVCLGKPGRIMDAASESLAAQLTSRALMVPEVGSCDSVDAGSVLGFDHGGATLYLVQATCIRKGAIKTHVNAVMECDGPRNRFAVLGLSWGSSKGHGVAAGVAVAGK